MLLHAQVIERGGVVHDGLQLLQLLLIVARLLRLGDMEVAAEFIHDARAQRLVDELIDGARAAQPDNAGHLGEQLGQPRDGRHHQRHGGRHEHSGAEGWRRGCRSTHSPESIDEAAHPYVRTGGMDYVRLHTQRIFRSSSSEDGWTMSLHQNVDLSRLFVKVVILKLFSNLNTEFQALPIMAASTRLVWCDNGCTLPADRRRCHSSICCWRCTATCTWVATNARRAAEYYHCDARAGAAHAKEKKAELGDGVRDGCGAHANKMHELYAQLRRRFIEAVAAKTALQQERPISWDMLLCAARRGGDGDGDVYSVRGGAPRA